MSTETTADTTELHLADDELLRKARAAANGAKFALRFDNGYESPALANRYDSRRTAARALLFNLGWWTNGDREQTRRLFERSELGREFEEGDLLDDVLPEMVDDVLDELDGSGYDPRYDGDEAEEEA